ncbi:TRAP transporter small permease [Photobacterium sp.]|uniref:TRAP transporter small permease n=1 Tax=Photobacterium sp. TaxID=660 RepID=UPI00299EBFC4|nr:TRAP transporter small permease [Photobacterium sp.]MDX1301450.1 TRAP transporter small permease [Photobacterium sp.]
MIRSKIFYVALGGLMLCVTLLLISEVILRSLFGTSLSWSYEIARTLMIWMVYIGAIDLTYRERHINITVIEDKFPILKKVTRLLMLSTQLAVGLVSISFLNIIIPYGQTSSTTGLPTWLNYVIIPVVFIMMLFNKPASNYEVTL